jgi:hypothetical protein
VPRIKTLTPPQSQNHNATHFGFSQPASPARKGGVIPNQKQPDLATAERLPPQRTQKSQRRREPQMNADERRSGLPPDAIPRPKTRVFDMRLF